MPSSASCALHHHLRGDAGVVGAGQPERVVAEHAMPADDDVDLGVLEHVAHVQDPVTLGGGMTSENMRPVLRPSALKMPRSIHHCAQCGSNRWFVHFLDLHLESQSSL